MLPCVESLGPGARQGASCLGWLALASPLGVAIRKLSCQNRAPGSATEIMALCRVLSPQRPRRKTTGSQAALGWYIALDPLDSLGCVSAIRARLAHGL